MGKIKVCLLRSSSASKRVIKLGIRTFYNYYYFETMDTGFWAYRGYLSTENHFLKIRQKSFSISKVKTLFGKMGMGVQTYQARHKFPGKPKARLPSQMNSLPCSVICKHHWCEASRDNSEEIKVSTTWLAASLLSPAILHHQAAEASHH